MILNQETHRPEQQIENVNARMELLRGQRNGIKAKYGALAS